MEGLFMGVLRAWHQNPGGAERAGEMDEEKQKVFSLTCTTEPRT